MYPNGHLTNQHIIQLTPEDQLLTSKIEDFHRNRDIVYPKTNPGKTIDDILTVFTERSQKMASIRTDIELLFPEDSDERTALHIFHTLAPSIDSIFFTLCKTVQQDRYKEATSWEAIDPTATHKLFLSLQQITEDTAYTTFFSRNPEYAEILELLQVAIPVSGNKKDLNAVTKLCTEKAVMAFEHGRLCPLFYPDSWYTNLYEHGPFRAEPAFQLNLPVTGVLKAKLDRISETATTILKQYYPTKEDALPGKTIFGINISGAGSELLSDTNGQALYEETYMLILNLFKDQDASRKIQELVHDGQFDLARAFYYKILLYIFHEQSHLLSPDDDTFPMDAVELVADLSMAQALLTIFSNNVDHSDFNVKDCITEMVAEYGNFSFEQKESNWENEQYTEPEEDRPYRISAIVLLNILCSSGVVEVSQNKLVIDTDPKAIKKAVNDFSILHRAIVSRVSHLSAQECQKLQCITITPQKKFLEQLGALKASYSANQITLMINPSQEKLLPALEVKIPSP